MDIVERHSVVKHVLTNPFRSKLQRKGSVLPTDVFFAIFSQKLYVLVPIMHR